MVIVPARQTRARLTTTSACVELDELTSYCNRRGLYTYSERLHEQRLRNPRLSACC